MSKRTLFLLIGIILVIAGFYARSHNAQQAQVMAAQLAEQDRQADASAALASLKAYVKAHMGASVDVTLQGAYARAEEQAKAAASATATNSRIYADAQRACSGKSDSVTQAKCNQDYLSKHLVSVPTAPTVNAPKLSDFQHKLRSPLWTPDLAGALLLGALVALGVAAYNHMGGRR